MNLYTLGYRHGLEVAQTLCHDRAEQVDHLLPDAHGGLFARRFAANGLLAVGALLSSLALDMLLPIDRDTDHEPTA